MVYLLCLLRRFQEYTMTKEEDRENGKAWLIAIR